MRLLFSVLAVFFMILLIYSCSSTRKTVKSSPINQGIRGFVREIKGNQMPSPDATPSKGHGFKTEVYVFEPTSINQVERIGSSPEYSKVNRRLIKSVETDSLGKFSIELPPGNYSVFTKVNGHYYANSFDAANNINLVSVKPGSVSQLNITISSKATF